MSQTVIVEVTGYEGDNASITVERPEDGRFELEAESRNQKTIYCVGKVGRDGMVRLIDWGYLTADAAFEAWPEAKP